MPSLSIRRVVQRAGVVAGVALAVACGTAMQPRSEFSTLDADAGSAGSPGSAGVPGAPGAAGSPGSAGGAGSFDPGGGGSPDGGDGFGPACATETKQAERLPLDLVFMLDTSGSMGEATAAPDGGVATTKWQAVRDAMTSFLQDPRSTGLGATLQYFPIASAGVPASCTNNAACNGKGPCSNYACARQGQPTFCASAGDCNGDACRQLGQCSNNQLCLVGDPTYGGCPSGPCAARATGYCMTRDSCDLADYSAPAVDIRLLPAAAGDLVTSMQAKAPDGLTPTSAALSGVLGRARAVAAANPTHGVAAVLMTDGFPTRCSPQDIPSIAALASGGVTATPSVKTFVIGVFTPAEKAQATLNLNSIALSGGTTSAFIIDTTTNVTAAFLQALDTIRGAALTCEYSVPVPEAGTPDFARVNVRHTSGAGVKTVLPYVRIASACDAGSGWYYDVDPATGATPTKILLCPGSCDVVKSDLQGAIEVLLGCKTAIPR